MRYYLRLFALLAVVGFATSGCATVKDWLGITPTPTIAQAEYSKTINEQLDGVVKYVSRPRCDKVQPPTPCAETARIDPLRRAASDLVDATDDYEAMLRSKTATTGMLKAARDRQQAARDNLAGLLEAAGV